MGEEVRLDAYKTREQLKEDLGKKLDECALFEKELDRQLVIARNTPGREKAAQRLEEFIGQFGQDGLGPARAYYRLIDEGRFTTSDVANTIKRLNGWLDAIENAFGITWKNPPPDNKIAFPKPRRSPWTKDA